MDTINAKKYEDILKRIHKLKTGKDGTLDGCAKADLWKALGHDIIILEDFLSNDQFNERHVLKQVITTIITTFEDISYIFTGIVKSIDVISNEIESLKKKKKSDDLKIEFPININLGVYKCRFIYWNPQLSISCNVNVFVFFIIYR